MATVFGGNSGRRGRRWRGVASMAVRLTALVAVLLGSGVVAAGSAAATEERVQSGYVDPELGEPVPVTAAGRPEVELPAVETGYLWQPSEVEWPQPAVATVDVTAEASTAGESPVTVSEAAGATGAARTADGSSRGPERVRVETLDRQATEAAGVAGLIFVIDGVHGDGEVAVTVDYSGFAGAYGGAWGSRLQLVAMPNCALTSPHLTECRRGEPTGSVNDVGAREVSATVRIEPARSASDLLAGDGALVDSESQPGTGSVFGLMAGESSEAGDWSATDLEASGSWTHGGSAGGFSYSYPMSVPPATGPVPSVGLGYSSQSHDGRTSGSNNQASWVGDGWGYQPGFIERSYRSCADDMDGGNNSHETGDLCWDGDGLALTLSLNGVNTSLVKDDSSGQWRAAADQGWRIEQLGSPASTSSATSERWVVTTTDGTRWFFAGEAASSNSRWTVPVFGNHSGEPCRRSDFKDSACRQAWRWMLDKVVDTSGNMTRYFYTTETGHYAAALDANDRRSFHRSGHLSRIDYGLREGQTGQPTARVVFTPGDRCLSNCFSSGKPRTESWPDTPWDRTCDAAPCDGQFSPSFFSSQRLTTVTTQVPDGSSFKPVDSWKLEHEFLDYGDESQVVMWLRSIQHTGHVGGTKSLPKIEFIGRALPNRVDHNQAASIWRSRLSAIISETGGVTTINYSERDCGAGDLPTPHTNNRLCYPVWWTRPFQSEPELDWFHKYVVESVVEQETTATGNEVWTRYDYATSGGGTSVLWGWNDGEFTDDDHRTYSQWRGFPQVTTRVGDPAEGAQLTTRTRYYRGMHDQPLPSGGKRSVQLTDAEGNTVTDHRALAGAVWEHASFLGGSIDSATTYRYWTRNTATRSHDGGVVEAWLTGVTREESRQRLVGSTWQRTRVDTTFDNRGRVVTVDDHGDVSDPGDRTCTRIEYADNTSAWILSAVSRTEVVATACGSSPKRPDHVIADQRTYYDGSSSHSASPSRGLPTRTEVLDSWSGGPVYVTTGRITYDALGRVTGQTDALGHTTTVAYTPSGAGPVTRTSTTNPLGHVTVTHLDRFRGVPTAVVDPNGRRTDLTYDPLGRLLAVWTPGLDENKNDPAMFRFEYDVSRTGPSTVTTRRLNAAGNYTTSVAVVDSLFREIQTQTETPLGGRLITETAYNTRGQVEFSSGPNWDETSEPDGTFVRVDQGADHLRTWYTYDPLGRSVKEEVWSKNVKLWETTTAYGGSSAGFMVRTNPPDGATATATITNARGEMVEKRDYRGGTASGSFDSMTYRYGIGGRLEQVTDPSGNQWSYGYDLRGRRVTSSDPDSGTTTVVYDHADQVASSTDARGERVTTVYDPLGRPTQRWEGPAGTGELLASWTYDTMPGGIGLPVATIAHVDGHEIRTVVSDYDDAGRPKRTTVTVPPIPGLEKLAKTFQLNQSFRVDGSVDKVTLPAVGDLPPEGITYIYNDRGLPAEMTGTLFDTFQHQFYVAATVYTAFGEVAQRTLAGRLENQVYQTYSYDDGTRRRAEFRLSRDAVGATNVAHLRYDYDHAGNVLSIADSVESAPGQPERQCFVYDHLRRLTEAWAQAGVDPCAGQPSAAAMGGPGAYWSSYSFDVTGNRTSEVRRRPGTTETRSYSYPGHGQPQPHTLTSVTTPRGVDNYTWDASGNMTARTVDGHTETLEWNAQGKPVSVSGSGGTTRMIYSPTGDRIARIDGNGDAHLFLFGHEISYTAATEKVTAVRSYSHNGAVVATRSRADGLQWLAADHHGTATWAVRAGAMTVTHRRQDPFGNPRGSQPVWPAGQEGFVRGIEDPTGLVHIGARSYDPETGRFVSSDPITNLTDSQQINGYTYANGNPVSFSDPTGMIYVCAPDGISLCPDQPATQQPQRRSVPSSHKVCPDGCRNNSGYTGPPTARHPNSAIAGLPDPYKPPVVFYPYGPALNDCDRLCRMVDQRERHEDWWKEWEEQVRRLSADAQKCTRNGGVLHGYSNGQNTYTDCTGLIGDRVGVSCPGAPGPGYDNCTYHPLIPKPPLNEVPYWLVDNSAPEPVIHPTVYFDLTICILICFGMTVDSAGVTYSVGGVGLGGFSTGVGANSAPSSHQGRWSWEFCGSAPAGGCVQGGGTTNGHPDPIWLGGGVTTGFGFQIGPKFTFG